MGSEHYCLRWNNHQSNLLGVFSQLLESESLVDVTLACTEGPSIRAHKVVLSACSSYFQALFLDHPNRHPIVILKDVRFAELRTLVDFMYKGEVNVEYCQLSALLKTAESLKVKGLADMTNINAAALQSTSSHSTNPIKEESSSSSSPPPPPTPSSGITLPITTILAPPPPPHSNASPPTSSATHNATSNSTAAANSNNNNNNSNNNNNNSGNNPSTTSNSNNSSTSASSHKSQQEARIDNPSRPPSSNDRHAAKDSSSHSNSHRERNSDRDRDRDCRERDRDRDRDKLDRDKRSRSRSRDRKHHHHHRHHQRHSDRHQQQAHQLQNDAIMIKSDVEDTESNECPSSPGDTATIAATTTATTTTTTRRPAASTSPCPGPLALDRPRSRRDSDSASLEETRGSLSPQSVHSGPSDMSLSNNTGGGGPAGAGGGGTVTPVTLPMSSLPQSRLPSPHSTEPLAGPSGLPPVQQVPLSLKKEVDWDRTEERSASSELSSDYRLPPDPELMGMDERVFACMYCGASFLHQSKLTRHILSHSLESLKYREQAAHLQLQAQQLGLEPSAAAAVTAGHLHLAAAAAAAEAGHYPAGVAAAAAAAVAASTGQPGGPLGPIEPMDLELASAVHSSSEPGSGVVLCKFCGKSFPDVGSLISHLPAHTGDRPFKCEFCGKAFKLRHHMKDHCRVHTGERPFRCSLCGKTFSRSTILKAHEKTHYPKYVRKFLSPSPVEPAEEESPTATGPNANATGNPPATNHPHSHH